MSVVLDILLVIVIAISLRKIALNIMGKTFVIAMIAALSITVIHYVFVPYMTSYNIWLIGISLMIILALTIYLIISKEDFGSIRIKLEDNITKGLMSGFVFIIPFIITVRVIPAFPFYIQLGIFGVLYGLVRLYRSKVNNKHNHIITILIVSSVLMVLINQYDFFEGGYSASQNLPHLNDTIIGDTYRRVERFSAPDEGGFSIYIKDTVYVDGVTYVVTDNNNVYMRKDDKTTTIYSGSTQFRSDIDNSLYDYGEYVYIIMNYDLLAYHKEDETITDVDITTVLEYMIIYEEDGILYYEHNNIVYELNGDEIELSSKSMLYDGLHKPYMYNQHIVYTRNRDIYTLENGVYVEIEYPYDNQTTYVSDNKMMFFERNHLTYVHIGSGYMYLDTNSELEHIYDGGIIVKTLIDGDFYIERYVEVDNVISGNIFINNNIYIILGSYLLLFIPIRKRR